MSTFYRTNQDVLNAVLDHFTDVNANLSRSSGGQCRYRTEEGQKCAIGCLFPDEMYDPGMEGGGIRLGAFHSGKVPPWDVVCTLFSHGVDREFLADLQSAHDNAGTLAGAIVFFGRVAQEYDLKIGKAPSYDGDPFFHTNQDVLDAVLAYFTKPDAVRAYDENAGCCVYRTPTGVGCAVGCLLPDEVATTMRNDNISGGSASWEEAKYFFSHAVDNTFLKKLQSAHDLAKSVQEAVAGFCLVAKDYDLKINFPGHFPDTRVV